MLQLRDIDDFLPKINKNIYEARPQVNKEFKEYGKKSKFKIFEVIKFMCKTKFNHFPLNFYSQ